MLKLRGTPRWDLATSDANLYFPAAADVFSCSLGIPVTEEDTPQLYMLLRRSLADIGLASYSAKNAYQRERPFMVNGQPICTPEEEEVLRKDGSYPSGHTSIGWGWALILSELSPEQTDALIARGRAFGESRNVCNVHWYSDVVAGRMVGAAAVAKLHQNDQFLAAMDGAREDIARARLAGLAPTGDCAAEASALATPLQ
jgi:acid phosphatase (class A)